MQLIVLTVPCFPTETACAVTGQDSTHDLIGSRNILQWKWVRTAIVDIILHEENVPFGNFYFPICLYSLLSIMCQLFLAQLMYSTSIAKGSWPRGYGTQAGVFDCGTKPIAGAFSMWRLKIVACDINCAIDDICCRNMALVLWAQPSVHSITDCNWVNPGYFLRMLSMPVSNRFVR